MGVEQKGASIFRVTRGDPGQWNVTEVGVDKALASFDSPKGARKYAREMAKSRKAAAIDEQSSPPLVKGLA